MGPCGGEGQGVPSTEGREHMGVGKSQFNGARPMGSCEGEPSVDSWGFEASEA